MHSQAPGLETIILSVELRMKCTFLKAGELKKTARSLSARHCVPMAATCMVLALVSGSPVSAEEDAWGGIRLFDANLSAGNQTTLTRSGGRGYANISFNIDTMEIEWEITHKGLTSPPVGIHLHGPAQPGTNAVQIIDLGINGLESPITGTVKISNGYVQYMLLGWTYVLLKSEEYPQGELRGKLDTVPPPDYLQKSRQWGRGELE